MKTIHLFKCCVLGWRYAIDGINNTDHYSKEGALALAKQEIPLGSFYQLRENNDEPTVAMRVRFDVIEYTTGYAVEDLTTGEKHWLGDGVDMDFTSENGTPLYPGSETFRKTWAYMLNLNMWETLEAYFPEAYDAEK